MFYFIVFEGLDRTGKTTIANRISKKINAISFYGIPNILLPYREYFDALNNDTTLAYYLICNHIVDYQISEAKNRKHVVCDRFFFSTIAYYSAKLGRNLDSYLKEIKNLPNKIYFLKGKIDEFDKRDREIGEKDEIFIDDVLLEDVKRNYKRILKKYSNVVIIDTTHKNEQEVYDLILKDLITIGIKI